MPYPISRSIFLIAAGLIKQYHHQSGEFMRIAVVGSGYVGLVSGACLADFGHKVVCIDKAEAKIVDLQAGRMPIYEPGLEDLVCKNSATGQLAFSTELAPAVADADVVFIAVGTPSRRGDGHADLSYIYEAAREIAAAVRGFTVVSVKSTVPVGTGDEVERIIRSCNPTADVAVVSNPEFLREGAAIDDFKRPDRIVIGLPSDERSREVMAEVYRPLYLNQAPIMFTGRRTASGSTTALVRNSCMQALGMGDPVFRKIRWLSSRQRKIAARRCG